MKTSKNPKVLNYVIKNVLNPILRKIELLKQKEIEHNLFITNSYKEIEEKKVRVEDKSSEYSEKEAIIKETIETLNERLSYHITSKLYDPNLKPDEGESGDVSPSTNHISDKALTTLSYGFVKASVSMVMAGIINNGLAIGKEAEIQNDFEFLDPKNNKFPSFHPNDILRLSSGSALIATNNGLVELDITTGKYLVRTTSYGLNTNVVKRVIPVYTAFGEKVGFLSGTSKGLSFSPNAIRWVNVDKSFISEITTFHTTQDLNAKYDTVFIGTPRGMYLLAKRYGLIPRSFAPAERTTIMEE